MRACLQRRVSTALCRGRGRPCEVAVWSESGRLLPPISLNGEILLRRYTRRNGTRSLAHDVV